MSKVTHMIIAFAHACVAGAREARRAWRVWRTTELLATRMARRSRNGGEQHG